MVNVEMSSLPMTLCELVVVSFSGWMTHCESYWASPGKLGAAWDRQIFFFSEKGLRKGFSPAFMSVVEVIFRVVPNHKLEEEHEINGRNY